MRRGACQSRTYLKVYASEVSHSPGSEPREIYAPDVDHCNGTEGEVTPFVGTCDQRADESGDDDDHGGKDGLPNVRQGHSSGKQKLDQEEREGNEPLDVPHILYKISKKDMLVTSLPSKG